jgi:hypothetical protein
MGVTDSFRDETSPVRRFDMPFFRYHRESRIIIYAWVDDEDTKRGNTAR